ncbi:MAG: prephenate dehydrogenase/arogenate dehydrogenase family protein [Chloroflexi bacterium]|nr:prephenate dehydrogenase/arogenate dehydrogenase family protein [Chloroflexota bacterium]MCL5075594.1 prephenate dehydrogenase/arogenate dehydrogenase family protein [Chloroflexota bacterium]
MAHITIIGLGLIGGSLGLALQRTKLGYEIIGHDLDPGTAAEARKRGAIDKAEWNLPAAVSKATLVIIATPVGAVKDTLRDIATYLPRGCVVTDTASTKQQVLAWADEMLPEGVSFVGGHPMAGKEVSGIAAADPDLFIGCTYCLLPSPGATAEAVSLVANLVSAIGAKPYFIDPVEHDSFVAAISHLPFILSTALVNTTAHSPAWREISRLAAGGFHDASRLASGDPIMYRDICLTNRDGLLRWMETFLHELEDMRQLIASGDERLEMVFQEAKEARDKWQSSKSEEWPGVAETLSPGEQMRHMFLGGKHPSSKRPKER